MKTPAAIAVPITPETFGPIACIKRKFEGRFIWRDREAGKIRNHLRNARQMPRVDIGLRDRKSVV